LRQGGAAQEKMEEAAVLQDPPQQPVLQRPLFLFGQDLPMNFFDEQGQIDAHGTHRFAGQAVEAVLHDGPVVLAAVVKIGENQADGADIDMAVIVAAHQRIDGTDIGAGAAADAAQDLGKDRIPGQGQAAVVQEDHVHLLAAPRAGAALGEPGDPGDIGGDQLAGGVLGQNLQDAQGRGQVRHQFIQAHQGYMDGWQGGGEAGVTLIGNDSQGAAGGNGEVGAADAHVGGQELLAQLPPGHLYQLADVVRVKGIPGDPGE